ncbi:MAG: MarR family winged helix-turn-helix transcriptional regulator [Marmoricola sp.]
MSTSDELEDLSSDLMVYAARLVRAVRRAVAQPAGIRVLSLLDEHGPLGITALAEADRCSQPTMSGTVNALVGRGWVTKRPHPDDARASLVLLTPAGDEALARIRRENGRAIADRLTGRGGHSPADVATAVAVLRDVLTTEPTNPESGSRTGPQEGVL